MNSMLLLFSKLLQHMSDPRATVPRAATYLAVAIQAPWNLRLLVTMDRIYKQP